LLAQRLGVDMPITEQVYRVLYAGADPCEASEQLMRRAARAEHPADLESITASPVKGSC